VRYELNPYIHTHTHTHTHTRMRLICGDGKHTKVQATELLLLQKTTRTTKRNVLYHDRTNIALVYTPYVPLVQSSHAHI
jgi:hypothetical protein